MCKKLAHIDCIHKNHCCCWQSKLAWHYITCYQWEVEDFKVAMYGNSTTLFIKPLIFDMNFKIAFKKWLVMENYICKSCLLWSDNVVCYQWKPSNKLLHTYISIHVLSKDTKQQTVQKPLPANTFREFSTEFKAFLSLLHNKTIPSM